MCMLFPSLSSGAPLGGSAMAVKRGAIATVAAVLLCGCGNGCEGFGFPVLSAGRGGAGLRSRGSLVPRHASGPSTEEELREALAVKNEDLSGLDSDKLEEFRFTDEELMKEVLKDRSYFSVLAEQVTNAVDEILEPLGRKGGDAQPNSDPNKTKPRVVVLGTGWASHAFLSSIDAEEFDVTVVSPRNFFLFTPMLAASAVGTVDYRSITEPIRKVNPLVNYLEATCTHIDSKERKITCENVVCEGTSCTIEDFELSYDYLLVGVGATTNTFGIPGVKEHCIFLKQITDAEKLRKAVGNCFERANLPTLTDQQRINALTFVIVGAGPTGVEFTAELRDFIEYDVPRFYPHLLKFVRIKLVEASDKVLMVFDEALQKEALKTLTGRKTRLIEEGYIDKEMTEVLLGTGVKEVTDTKVEFTSGESVPYGLAVWAAGNGPLPLVLDLIEETPEQKEKAAWGRGRLVVDDWLRVKGSARVFALGDCGVVDGRPLPQTAQVASQQGTYLAHLFTRGYDLQASAPIRSASGTLSLSENLGLSARRSGDTLFAKPFAFLSLGILAYTGNSEALAQVEVGKGMIKGSGQAGFLLWRSVYLSKQVSWRNRTLVAIDWLKARVFGRDIVRF